MASKSRQAAHLAALRVIEQIDDDITPETIYWRALFERCKRFAEIENKRRDGEPHISRTAEPLRVTLQPAALAKIMGMQ